jgi:CBS domain-containing protein
MVMLSQLLRCKLIDAKGVAAKLSDLSVDLLNGDYPPVTRFYFLDANNQKRSLAASEVQSIAWADCRITVSDLAKSGEESTDSLAQQVLLRTSILDALILDLQNRRATRANDLLLAEEGPRLELRAADTGFGAMLRRLTGGRLRHISQKTLFDWKYVEFLRGEPTAVASESGKGLRINRLPAIEIARLADALPYLHAAELLTLLADPKAADTLETMAPARQLQVFEELEEAQAVRLLTLMAPDLAADLVARLQTKTMRRYLELLPRKQAERIIELLRYPENTVGGIMTNDVVWVAGRLTVAQAREHLRESLKGPDFVILIYVVADEVSRQLRGVISLRELLTAADEAKLEEIMDPFLVTLEPLAAAETSAHRVIDSHMAGLPVVNKNKQLLGVVTVDAAVSAVAPSSWSAQAPRIFS